MKIEQIKSELILFKQKLLEDKELKEQMEKLNKAKSFCKFLQQNNINFDVCIKHKEVLGCDESHKCYQRFQNHLTDDYIICKNLFVHERKGEKRNFLIITDSNKQVDLSSLRETLDCKKLEFVKEEQMQELINTTPGNVSLFNMIYDKEKQVELVLDEDLLTSSSLAFHPLYNGMSMFLKPKECFKFLGLINRSPKVIPISEKQQTKTIRKVMIG